MGFGVFFFVEEEEGIGGVSGVQRCDLPSLLRFCNHRGGSQAEDGIREKRVVL